MRRSVGVLVSLGSSACGLVGEPRYWRELERVDAATIDVSTDKVESELGPPSDVVVTDIVVVEVGPECPPGTNQCRTGCVNLQNDPSNCGGCGVVCSSSGTSAARCVGGRCVAPCRPGSIDCDGQLANGCEVDPLSDRTNCGGCRRLCPSDQICVGGACASPGCPPTPFNMVCGGLCVDTRFDAAHCGECSAECLSAGGPLAVCFEGACGRCPLGTTLCTMSTNPAYGRCCNAPCGGSCVLRN